METFPEMGVRMRRPSGSFVGQSGRGLNFWDWEAEGERMAEQRLQVGTCWGRGTGL